MINGNDSCITEEDLLLVLTREEVLTRELDTLDELTAEETYQLALESILRWAERGNIAAIIKVAETALNTF